MCQREVLSNSIEMNAPLKSLFLKKKNLLKGKDLNAVSKFAQVYSSNT